MSLSERPLDIKYESTLSNGTAPEFPQISENFSPKSFQNFSTPNRVMTLFGDLRTLRSVHFHGGVEVAKSGGEKVCHGPLRILGTTTCRGEDGTSGTLHFTPVHVRPDT
ncbi:hypothetical protein CEXT_144191 [Caerostris extrusa]|uniref:Uncharacterized protein n=1 Tax=Caerostris extrusa TaxID=172846 RepID=A0AAV4VC96_CAEEX|nr:hypothetical protein CEXT_144191 [Caerostris extrusa]